MIESALYFVLGFLAASILALMVMPSIWRRAVRLTHRRIESSTPLTLAEIKASRDQMRAEYARETRRLEIAVAESRRRGAEHQIAADRNLETARRAERERDALAGRIKAMETGRTGTLARAEAATAATAAADRLIDFQSAELAEMKSRLADLLTAADSHKIEVAALRTMIQGLEARAESLGEERKTLVQKLEAADLAAAAGRETIARLEANLAETSRELASRIEEIRTAALAVARSEARIAALYAESAGLRASLVEAEQRAAEAVAASGDNVAKTVESLEKANAELAQQVARLATELEAARLAAAAAPASVADTALVRARLAELAARVVAIADGAGPPAPAPSPEAPVEAGADATAVALAGTGPAPPEPEAAMPSPGAEPAEPSPPPEEEVTVILGGNPRKSSKRAERVLALKDRNRSSTRAPG